MLNNSEKLVQQGLVSLSCNHDSNVLTICEPQREKNQSHTGFESNSKNGSSGNRILSLEPSEFLLKEFLNAGISQEVFDHNIRLINDLEFDPITNEVTATPIDDVLGNRYTRFGHNAKENRTAAVFTQETGDVWQLKIFGETTDGKRTGNYLAPKGIGDKLYLPNIPRETINAIASENNLNPPENGSFWQWFKDHKEIPLIVTEGGKKALAAISQGNIALSLFGCSCGVKDGKIKPELLPYVEGRRVLLAFDRDEKAQARHKVFKATKRLASAITYHAKGFPFIMTWDGKQGKGLDDLIANDPALFHNAIATAKSLDEWNLVPLTDLIPYLDKRISTRYLPEDLNPPEDAQLIAIKSPKNTGKTTWLVRQVKKILRQHGRVLVITHRIKLAQHLCNVFEIDHIDEIKDSDTGGISGYGLCIDSLHSKSKAKFNPLAPQWEECVVIIDECEQVFRHILSSDTCKYNRVAILETLQNLLKTVISTRGKIYLSDADLSPVSINYVERMIGISVNRWIVQNDFNPNKGKRKLFVYDDTEPARLMMNCQNAIRNGEKVLIHLSAQTEKSKWGTINVESTLRKKFPDKNILRIDAETVADPNHEAYGIMDNLNNTLSLYDIVIASPTIETGVSIEIEHFNSVWCIAQCVQTVEAVCQTIERYRLDVDRHIWIAKSSPIHIGNGTTNINSLLRTEHKKADSLSACIQADKIAEFDGEHPEHFQTWAKFACLANDGYKNYRARILEKLENEGYELIYVNQEENDLRSELEDIKDNLKSLNTPLEKIIQKRINDVEKIKNDPNIEIPQSILDNMVSKTPDQIRLEETEERSRLEPQKNELEQRASELEAKLTTISNEIKSVKLAQKTEKEINYEKHCIAVANAQNLDDKEYEKLKDKRSKTVEERLQEKKGMITRRYLTPDVTPQMVRLDDNGWYNALSLHYFLTVGYPYLKDSDFSKLEKLGKNSQGKTFKPDVNKSMLSLKVEFLKHLGIERFFDTEKDFTKDNLREWVNELNQHFSSLRWNLKEALGITINFDKESPINIVQKLLGLVGLKLKCDRQNRVDGTPVRFYRLASLDPDGRAAIFTRWEDRDLVLCHTKTYKYNLTDFSVTQIDPKSPEKPIGVAPLPVAEPMEPAAPSPVEAITDFSVTPQINSENDPFAVFKEGDRYGLWNQGLRKYVEATVKQVCHGLKGFVRLVTDDGFYGLCIELSMANWICHLDQIDSLNAIAS